MPEAAPPEELLKRIANNPSVQDFSRSFDPLRKNVLGYLVDAGFDFAGFANILDFGCGVGRFLYAFEPVIKPGQRLYGCDVFEACASWCQQNISFAQVVCNSIHPPLPYEDCKFDLVYALSVYTHLRLEMQFKWAWEIHRVLRPGGVLFATIHGPAFIPMLYENRQGEALQVEFRSFGDDGLFAYMAFKHQELDDGQVHVTSAQNIEFMREQFAGFEIVRRYPESRMAAGQDLYILRKPQHGRTIERCDEGRVGDIETVSFAQDISEDGQAESVLLTFNINGHDRFHVYPVVESAGLGKITCRVEIRSGSCIIANEKIPFNTIRIFGKTHHSAIGLDVPVIEGQVTVSLSAKMEPSALRTKSRIRWEFPHFT